MDKVTFYYDDNKIEYLYDSNKCILYVNSILVSTKEYNKDSIDDCTSISSKPQDGVVYTVKRIKNTILFSVNGIIKETIKAV